MSAAADRSTITSTRAWVLTALVAAQLWAALASLPNSTSPERSRVVPAAAALCAALAMFGLRSVPIRWIVRSLTLLSGVLLARFGELGVLGGLSATWKVLLWLGATAAALALAPSSRAIPGREPGTVIPSDRVPPPDSDAGDAGDPEADHSRRRRPVRAGTVPAALVIAAVSLIGASALLVGPRTSNLFPTGSSAGEALDLRDNNSGNAMVATDSLDMTRRPSLTERVVLNVRSPIASFWRTETFDQWDGVRWTRSGGRQGAMLDDGQVVAEPFDLAATAGRDGTDGVQLTDQEFRIEVGFATAAPAAPAPIQVDSVQPLGQRSDGTLVAPVEPLRRGSTYTVRSAQLPTTPDLLREASQGTAAERAESGAVPEEMMERFARSPVASQRTVDLVDELIEGTTNDYDRIRAFERWMDDNTTYSLDAPLSPQGVDVVDHFLFESRQGWCEQIASSLVVMARTAGIPARLATGFAPGDWDAASGRFVVRENDAHAWAEVWFPDYGWITFDPTAQVPLAGTPDATPGVAAFDWREALGSALAVLGVVALAAGPVRRGVERVGEQIRVRSRRRRLIRERWDVAEEYRIEAVGAQAGRPRRHDETISAYAGALSELVDDPDLAESGASIDRFRYEDSTH